MIQVVESACSASRCHVSALLKWDQAVDTADHSLLVSAGLSETLNNLKYLAHSNRG